MRKFWSLGTSPPIEPIIRLLVRSRHDEEPKGGVVSVRFACTLAITEASAPKACRSETIALTCAEVSVAAEAGSATERSIRAPTAAAKYLVLSMNRCLKVIKRTYWYSTPPYARCRGRYGERRKASPFSFRLKRTRNRRKV